MSEEHTGGKRKIISANDQSAGFEVQENFERFHQKNDIFRRSWWDDTVRTEKTDLFYATYREPLKTWRKADGFTQKDYALRNASWHVSDIFSELKEAQDRREGFTDVFTVQREPGLRKDGNGHAPGSGSRDQTCSAGIRGRVGWHHPL